jgi:hypothetical protein
MPIIRKKTDLADGATAFPLQGSQYEYLPFNALLEFAIVQLTDATATTEATVYSGSDVLQEQSECDQKAALSAIYPDDFTLQDVAAAGERIGVQLVAGPTGETTDRLVLTVVRITPL